MCVQVHTYTSVMLKVKDIKDINKYINVNSFISLSLHFSPLKNE